MPIFEYICTNCGTTSEHLVFAQDETIVCPHCKSEGMKKLLSATSSASGARDGTRLPGAGDTGCCGSQPSSRGCIPGSCCGKA